MGADFLNRVLSRPQVEDLGEFYHISGVNVKELQRYLSKTYRTSVVNHIMISPKRNGFDIYKFFALELSYIVDGIIDDTPIRFEKEFWNDLKESLVKNTWLQNIESGKLRGLDFSQLDDLIWTPQKHQMDFLVKYDTNVAAYNLNGYLLPIPPGGGKTFASIAWNECLNDGACFVISPKTAIDDPWIKTLTTQFKTPRKIWAITDGKPFKEGYDYYIYNYDALNRAVEDAETFGERKLNIIVDESHNLNELSSTRTNLFIDLCTQPNTEVLEISGTPFKALAVEAIPLLRIIDPLFTPEVEAVFKKIFSGNRGLTAGILSRRINEYSHEVMKEEFMNVDVEYIDVKVTIPDGADYTLRALAARAGNFIEARMDYYKENFDTYLGMFQLGIDTYAKTLKVNRERQQLQNYLRDVQWLRRYYSPMSKQAQQIAKSCNDFEKTKIEPTLHREVLSGFRDAKTVVKYVKLKVRGETLGQLTGVWKAECLLKMIPESGLGDIVDEATKKTLIFSNFVDVAKEIDHYLKGEGYKPALYHSSGKTTLAQTLKAFQIGDSNPLISTYKSLSTAVPLIEANVCILYDLPYRDYIHNQASSRIYRMGQDSKCLIVSPLLDTGDESNITTRAQDIMVWSKEEVDKLMGRDYDSKFITNDLTAETSFVSGLTINEMNSMVKKYGQFLSRVVDWFTEFKLK